MLPDLPELESVEANIRGHLIAVVVALVFAGGFLSVILWVYLTALQSTADLRNIIVISAAISAGLCLWLLYRLVFDDFAWHSDSTGLFQRNLVRRKFTPWDRMSGAPARLIKLATQMYSLTALAASVWQHCRRHRVPGAELSMLAQSFWGVVPDEVPTVIEWEDPKNVRRAYRAWVATGLVLAAIGLGLFAASFVCRCADDLRFFAFILGLYVPLFVLVHAFGLRSRASFVQLDSLSLQVHTLRGLIGLEAAQVVRARWLADGLSLHTAEQRVVIPSGVEHEETGKLILAIVRWLRSAAHPIPVTIPPSLRSYPCASPEEASEIAADTAKLRTSLGERIVSAALPIMLLVVPALGASFDGSMNRVIGMAIAGGGVVLAAAIWWLANSYSMIADSDGLTKTFLWWKRRLLWIDVSDYTQSRPMGSRSRDVRAYGTVQTFRTADGRIAMRFSLDVGSGKDRERLMRFIHGRLAEHLPPEKLNKPWKSRPWEPPTALTE